MSTDHKKIPCSWKPCKKPFVPKVWWQKYHSRKCRDAAFEHRQRELLKAAQTIIEQKQRGA